MLETAIKVDRQVKKRLDKLGEKGDTYNDILKKMLSFIENGGNIKFHEDGSISKIEIFEKKKEQTA